MILPKKNNNNKDKNVRALIDLSSKVIIINFIYIIKLGFCAKKINIGILKIDKYYLNIFGIIIIDYSIKNKLEKIKLF